jgi:predicted ATP-grasp superfamily ATP-dependent carboligase
VTRPVLLVGIDTPIGLAVMRELGRHGVAVHGVGRSENALGRTSRYCTFFHLRGQGALANWLPDMIETSKAAAVMAVSEGDLLELAALPQRIGNCSILTPRADKLALVFDKAKTLALAQSVGIDVPVAYANEPDRWPVVLKWADSGAVQPLLEAAGIPFHKAEIIRDATALPVALARYAPLGLQPLIQSYAAGQGLGQMFYRHRGKTTLYFQHERLHEWPPEGGVSTLCQALDPDLHREQRAKSEALLDAIGWEGPAMVEYRHDPQTGAFVLMEINGRFWGSLPLASAAGAEFGWEQYRRLVLDDASPNQPYRARIKAAYMIPETRRLVRILFQQAAIRDPMKSFGRWQALAEWFACLFGADRHFYVYCKDDPGPFWADMKAIVKKLWPLGK